MLHRDLKPANIMFRDDGTLALIDFGLAKSMALEAAITGTGQIFGTPSYMAPEQVQHGVADARSDLYALGCVLHELLSGVQLFAGQTAYAIFERQVREAPGPLPGAPPALARVVLDLLAKDPAGRPADAAVLHDRLAPLAVDLPPLPGFLAPDPGPGRGPRAPAPPRRPPGRAAAAGP